MLRCDSIIKIVFNNCILLLLSLAMHRTIKTTKHVINQELRKLNLLYQPYSKSYSQTKYHYLSRGCQSQFYPKNCPINFTSAFFQLYSKIRSVLYLDFDGLMIARLECIKKGSLRWKFAKDSQGSVLAGSGV